MSIFSSILQKIGIGKPSDAEVAAAKAKADADAKAKADAAVSAAMAKAAEEAKARVAAAQAKPATTAPAPVTPAVPAPAAPTPVASAPVAAHPAAIPVVDVVAKIEGLAKAHPGLNWKVSIVDLLKVLELDSSFDARKELAEELGCPANLMSDSASMNTWLHKTVLQKIAENGGNIPASLLQSDDVSQGHAATPGRREQE